MLLSSMLLSLISSMLLSLILSMLLSPMLLLSSMLTSSSPLTFPFHLGYVIICIVRRNPFIYSLVMISDISVVVMLIVGTLVTGLSGRIPEKTNTKSRTSSCLVLQWLSCGKGVSLAGCDTASSLRGRSLSAKIERQ